MRDETTCRLGSLSTAAEVEEEVVEENATANAGGGDGFVEPAGFVPDSGGCAALVSVDASTRRIIVWRPSVMYAVDDEAAKGAAAGAVDDAVDIAAEVT